MLDFMENIPERFCNKLFHRRAVSQLNKLHPQQSCLAAYFLFYKWTVIFKKPGEFAIPVYDDSYLWRYEHLVCGYILINI